MNKLTITRVALGSLSRRRGQYKAMILGAGLAIFFVSSLFLAVQSVMETYRLAHVARVGSQDVVVWDAEAITPELLLESGLVAEVGSVHVIGETEDTKCPIGYYDAAGAAMDPRQVIEGRLPEQAGEIAVEPDFLQKQRSSAKVGDEITVKLKVPVGKNAQFLPDPVTKTYRLVGTLKPQSNYLVGNVLSEVEYLHYPSAIVSSAELVELGGRTIVHRLVKLAPGVDWGVLNGFTAEQANRWSNLRTEFSLFGYDSNSAQENTEGMIMVLIAGILGAVLILAACLGIVNAFSGSLTSRRNQIGMMRAVGATSRQIRQVFGREALILALGIAPVAIALSYLFVWGLTMWIGSVQFYQNPWFLPVDVAASLLCVALAAWVPLRAASKLPPMQAIRDVSLLRARKRIKLRQKAQYDAPRLIATRHLSLYRTRQAGIAAMVAISMLIISVALPFVSSLVTTQSVYAYQIAGIRWHMDPFVENNVTPHMGLTDVDAAEVKSLPLVADVDVATLANVNMQLSKVTPYAYEMGGGTNYWNEPRNQDDADAQEGYRLLKDAQHIAKEVVPTDLFAGEEDLIESLAPYVIEGTIDLAALNAGREVLIIAPKEYYIWEERTEDRDGGTSVTREWSYDPIRKTTGISTFTNDMYRAGDVLPLLRLYTRTSLAFDEDEIVDYLTGVKREEATAIIGAVLNADAFNALGKMTRYWAGGLGELVTTHQGMAALGIEPAGYSFMGVRLTGEPDDATHDYLTDQLKGIAARGSELDLSDNIQASRDASFWMGVMQISLLAVVLLMMSMCVSLVNSAISNRVKSEKRAIGTLRAVGAGLQEIVRSYRLQALAMVGWGVLAGLVLSGAYYLWYYITQNMPYGDPLKLQLAPVGAAQLAFLVAVALCCGVNLSLRIREITRDSIVSNIREL